MSAEDNLGKQFTLYHGTKAKLKKGDVVLPTARTGIKPNWPWLPTESKAFATEHLGAAKYFASASNSPSASKMREEELTIPEGKTLREFLQSRPAPNPDVERVYEVEPLGKTTLRNLSKSRAKNAEAIVEHSSEAGFKVKRQVWKRKLKPGAEEMPSPKGLS